MPDELLVVCGADDCRLALKGSDILFSFLFSFLLFEGSLMR